MSLWVTLSLLVTIIIIFVDQTRASPAWPGKTEGKIKKKNKT